MISTLDLLVPHATTFALTVTRCSGFVVASPFPGEWVPASQRVGLVAVLAFAVTFSVHPAPVPFDAHVLVAGTGELLLGALVGLVFRFMFVAADVVGAALSQATGLNSASVLNPATESHDTTPSRIVSLAAMLVALGVGAHRVVLSAVIESFRVIPPGSPIDASAGALELLHVAVEGIGVGLRLSMPLVAVMLITQVTLAFVARTAPSIQLFSAGLTVLVGSGLLTLMADGPNLLRGFSAHISNLGPDLAVVVSAVARGRP
jgi:flagellar biosynthetic protein FliR